MTTSTQTQDVLNGIKTAFAPFADTFKTIEAKIEIPEAAREFVKRSAETAKDRATEIHTGAEELSRNIQQAVRDDTTAFLTGVEKLASAKSLGEALTIQTELLRAQGDVAMARTKATGEYLGKLFADGAKAAQDSLSKVTPFGGKSA